MGKARRLSRLLHAELTERFPIAFPKDYEAIKPLKIGIYEDLCEALGEDVDKALLKTVLKNQTSRDGYLLALMRQDHRIDLQGQPAGTITEDAKALASKKIEVSQRRQQEKAEEENRRLQE
ncbi:MAG: hypothetical protein GY807_20245, partial [Gammaproteobacteria bacterium]|nr:hypothetical protein [Gammaproteobacteria bacterium]